MVLNATNDAGCFPQHWWVFYQTKTQEELDYNWWNRVQVHRCPFLKDPGLCQTVSFKIVME